LEISNGVMFVIAYTLHGEGVEQAPPALNFSFGTLMVGTSVDEVDIRLSEIWRLQYSEQLRYVIIFVLSIDYPVVDERGASIHRKSSEGQGWALVCREQLTQPNTSAQLDAKHAQGGQILSSPGSPKRQRWGTTPRRICITCTRSSMK